MLRVDEKGLRIELGESPYRGAGQEEALPKECLERNVLGVPEWEGFQKQGVVSGTNQSCKSCRRVRREGRVKCPGRQVWAWQLPGGLPSGGSLLEAGKQHHWPPSMISWPRGRDNGQCQPWVTSGQMPVLPPFLLWDTEGKSPAQPRKGVRCCSWLLLIWENTFHLLVSSSSIPAMGTPCSPA